MATSSAGVKPTNAGPSVVMPLAIQTKFKNAQPIMSQTSVERTLLSAQEISEAKL